MKPLKILDAIIDIVLAYRPKPKSKKARRREEEWKKIDREVSKMKVR